MRKVDPADVGTDFMEAVKKTKNAYKEIEAVGGVSDSTLKLIAEQTLVAGVVLWEGFIANLIGAYINRDSSIFVRELEGRVRQSVEGKYGRNTGSYLRMAFPQHLKKDRVQGLLDPNDQNLTFKSSEDMMVWVKSHLAPAHAAKFLSLRARDKAAVDAWVALRHFIAHRSGAAERRMNMALANKSVGESFCRGQKAVRSAGAFLKAKPKGKSSARIRRFLNKMRTLAAKLSQ